MRDLVEVIAEWQEGCFLPEHNNLHLPEEQVRTLPRRKRYVVDGELPEDVSIFLL